MVTALTIAGSDSGGGAGIQADIKSMSANGVFAMSAITAITCQNTCGVTAIHNVPLDIIEKQIDAVMSDIGADGVKTGMLSTAAIISLVARKAREWKMENLVVDPVMVATSGAKLLDDDAIDTLKRELIPLAKVLTPNLPEASALTGRTISTLEEMHEAARELVAMGAHSVVVKGGHGDGELSIDLYFDGGQFVELPAHRVDTKNTHGTGCSFASAVCAHLALGEDTVTAVRHAKEYITRAIESAKDWEIGAGSGPVDHFFAL